MSDRFTIDSDELDTVIGDVEKCEKALEALTSDLDRQVAALQSVWEGLAADAQQEAHEEWTQGMLTMRQAMADLRAAARTAHDNYTGAAEANVSMWEQLR
jgi:WXG100 family type VII secretion target